MATAKAVYQGYRTIIEADGLTPSDTILGTTTNINIDNCMLMYTLTGSIDSNVIERTVFVANLAIAGGNVVIEWSRGNANNTAPDVELEWVVTEFAAASMEINVQRGERDNTVDVNDITISAVIIDQTMYLTSYKTIKRQQPVVEETGFKVSLNSTTVLRYDFGGFAPETTECEIGWQVIVFKSGEMHVQHGITAYTTTGTASLTGFTTLANMFVLKTGHMLGNYSGNRSNGRVEIDSTSQVSFDTQNFGTLIETFTSWSCFEVLDATTVEKGEVVYTDTDTVPATQPSFTALDPDFAGVLTGLMGINNAFNPSTDSDGNIASAFSNIYLDGDGAGVHIERVDGLDTFNVQWVAVGWVKGAGASGVSRVGFTEFKTSITVGAVSYSHRTTPGTSLITLAIAVNASIGVTVVPQFNSVNMTLIKQTTASGSANDMTTFTYGVISPTSTVANITFTVDETTYLYVTAVNYIRTKISSVADAVKFLSEDVNDVVSNTSVHPSAGSSGESLFFFGTFKGAGGTPASNDATFNELSEGDTGTNSNNDLGWYVADKVSGAPSAITVTWAQTDENASQLLEILEEVGVAFIAPPPFLITQQAVDRASLH